MLREHQIIGAHIIGDITAKPLIERKIRGNLSNLLFQRLRHRVLNPQVVTNIGRQVQPVDHGLPQLGHSLGSDHRHAIRPAVAVEVKPRLHTSSEREHDFSRLGGIEDVHRLRGDQTACNRRRACDFGGHRSDLRHRTARHVGKRALQSNFSHISIIPFTMCAMPLGQGRNRKASKAV